ncbi:tyrosine-protein kinase [Pedobacter sp. BAL39]|uniref:GumC family protein n=1 Tax=Pedobacter sp. BAL39 TaxID=391596 RepID=UPI00015593E5|nr:tyrosine-protein kinase family protein [Pedobacter sp. BAL39]EDM37123.1 tyrosine-protein kinase [Pedobacter sp. BAL39]
MTGESRKGQRGPSHREVDLLKITMVLFSRWYIIASTTLICLIAAYAYLWYTPKTYATTAILKFEEQKTALSDIADALNTNTATNMQSESFAIESRHLLLNAIKRLQYHISFYSYERLLQTDLYPQQPLQIDILKIDSLQSGRQLILFDPIDHEKFTLTWTIGKEDIRKNFRFNSRIKVGNVSFMIRNTAQAAPSSSYLFRFNTPEDFLDRIREGLRIGEAGKNSNILSLQQTDVNPRFAADILNAILQEYLDYDKLQKTQSATQMIGFINEQLKHLSSAVSGAEKSLETYKQQSKVMDISVTSEHTLDKVSDLESQQSILRIQLIAIDQLRNTITTEQTNTPLNLSLEGTIDPLLATLAQNLNSLLHEKEELLKVYNGDAQAVMRLNRQIQEVRKAAMENINASQSRTRKSIDYLAGQIAQINGQISSLPTAEKDLFGLRRTFQLNEKVFSFLSEKNLETQINRAAIVPGATIIERAETNETPVSPREKEIYRTAVVLGLLSGIAIIILIRALNTYIYDATFVMEATSTPILGSLRKTMVLSGKKEDVNILCLSQPRSIFAESIRNIRTNINFIAAEKTSKVICITSEISGEGKSFVSVNLASTMALIDKKTVIIDADLRRPKLHQTFPAQKDNGLSNYLIGQLQSADIVHHSGHKNLDYIHSGPTPPNPAELLHSKRMQSLISELRTKYDIILIDTAPVGLVSDPIPLIRWADISIFVIRYGVSKNSAANLPQSLSTQYKLDNTYIILNAFEDNSLYADIYKRNNGNAAFGSYHQPDGKAYYLDEQTPDRWWNIRSWFKS